MKLTGKKIKSMLLCMMLAMAFTVAGCGSKTEGYSRCPEKHRDSNCQYRDNCRDRSGCRDREYR